MVKEIGTVTANDTAKFGTYTRDAGLGLDYAMNRYYQSTWGRFTSPDPYRASGGPADPGSWNRYSYVQGDPVDYGDPNGLLASPMQWGDWAQFQCFNMAAGLGGFDWAAHVCLGVGGGGSGGGVDTASEPWGGGRGGLFIKVKNPSKSGPKQDRIRKVLSWISENTDEDCRNWLGSSFSTAIASLLGDPTDSATVYIGHGDFSTPFVSAFTGNNTQQTNIPVGFAITINDTGGFFNSATLSAGKSQDLSPGGYVGGSNQAQVYVLLHELAHFLNAPGFLSDFGNPVAGATNDRTVNDNCGKTINASKKLR